MKRKITLEIESTASLETSILREIARQEKMFEIVHDKIEEEIFEDGICELKEIAIQIARQKWNI